VRKELVSTDARSDGMFPLVTNCWDLPLKAVLQAYKFQPKLEKRHEQLKSVQEVTPVWLKNVSRVEGLLFLYFVALIVQALLERELRRAMARKGIKSLPLYPEEREWFIREYRGTPPGSSGRSTRRPGTRRPCA
jgi:transposase